MNNRTPNFNQRGFTKNLLAFMNRLEQNERCCLDFLTQIYTEDSDSVTFTGSGTQADPLIATAIGGGGAGNPALPFTAVQFNDGGVFGGNSAFTFDIPSQNINMAVSYTLGTGGRLRNARQTIYTNSIPAYTIKGVITEQGAVPGNNTYGNFWETLEQTTMNEDGQRDCVWEFGYNNDGSGSRVNLNEAAMWEAWESNYIPYPGGPRNFERHFEACFENGVNKRLSSYTFGKAAPGAVNLNWRIDNFTTTDSANENTIFSFNQAGSFLLRGSVAGGGFQLVLEDNSIPSPTLRYTIQPQTTGIFHNSGGIPLYFEGQTARFGGANEGGPVQLPINVMDHYNGNNSSILIDAQSTTQKKVFDAQGTVDGLMNISVTNNSTAAGAQVDIDLIASGTNEAFVRLANATDGNSIYLLKGPNATFTVSAFGPATGNAFINYITVGAPIGVAIFGNPINSAALTVNSTTQGFAPPRMTTAQKLAIVTPDEGIMVYDTDLHQLSYYNGTLWVNV